MFNIYNIYNKKNLDTNSLIIHFCLCKNLIKITINILHAPIKSNLVSKTDIAKSLQAKGRAEVYFDSLINIFLHYNTVIIIIQLHTRLLIKIKN